MGENPKASTRSPKILTFERAKTAFFGAIRGQDVEFSQKNLKILGHMALHMPLFSSWIKIISLLSFCFSGIPCGELIVVVVAIAVVVVIAAAAVVVILLGLFGGGLCPPANRPSRWTCAPPWAPWGAATNVAAADANVAAFNAQGFTAPQSGGRGGRTGGREE